MKRLFVFFVLLLLASFPCFSQGYEINISMKTKNDTVYLTHIFAKEDPLRLDTTIVLKNGKGVFKSDEVLPKGLYYIVNDSKSFQILIGNNQKFAIEADTTDFYHLNRFAASTDNDVFYNYLRDNIQRGKQQQQLIEQYQNTTDDAEKKTINEQLQALYKEKMALTQKSINDNEGLYVSKYLKAQMPLELPELPREEQYYWYRAHYFDNFNIYDPDMLRTPLYEKKLTDYLTWFSQIHLPDTVCAEMDRMLTKAMHDKEVFRCVLATMFNYFSPKEELIAHDNFVVNLVDNWYIPHAEWATNIEEMKKYADKVRPTLIGKLAPPLEQLMIFSPEHFKAAALDTAIKNDMHAGRIISDFRNSINSKYLAILFWDIGCSHCKEKIQQLWEVYEACKDKGLQIIAVQTLWDGKARWVDFINEHDMLGNGWFNAWIIYDLKWHDLYNASVVPILYLLNEKKEIILKGNIDPQEIQSRIEAFAGMNQE